MKRIPSRIRRPLLVIGSASLIALTGCEGDRTAEADTPVSEAEVSTDLPETAVSDTQLEATANAAAEVAATPIPDAVAVPVPVDGTAAGNGAASAGNNTTGQ